jgi:hypothetical protein|nr:MAG TPA: Sporulation protein Cse60 [Caudoviricetes sp.]
MKLYKTYHLVVDSRSGGDLQEEIQKVLDKGSSEGFVLTTVQYSTCSVVNYNDTVVFSAVVIMEK